MILAVLVLLLLAGSVQAAVLPLQVNRTEATVGDPILLTLTIPKADPDDIQWPPTTGTLGDFHILKADTITGKAAKAFDGPTLTWTVAAYDTGAHTTDTLEVWVDRKIHQVAPATVTIQSVLDTIPQDTTGPDFRPLKAQVPLKMTFMDWVRLLWPWVLGVAVLVGLFFLLRWWRKRKLEQGEAGILAKPPPPPYDEAIAALRDLQRDNPYDKGEAKLYVSRLTEILKRLLERVHGDPVMDMTTYEVQRWLQHVTLRSGTSDLLKTLTDSDRVKFAKGVLEPERAKDMMDSAERFVLAYKPRPEELAATDPATAVSQKGTAAIPSGSTMQPTTPVVEPAVAPPSGDDTSAHEAPDKEAGSPNMPGRETNDTADKPTLPSREADDSDTLDTPGREAENSAADSEIEDDKIDPPPPEDKDDITRYMPKSRGEGGS